MRLLVPLFPASALERELALSGHGPLAPLAQRLAALAAPSRTLLVTDCPEAAQACKRVGIAALVLDGLGPGEPGLLPPGTLAAAAAVAGDPLWTRTPVCVADPRCPLLAPGDLAAAGERLRSSGAEALLSVREARDHPVQFERAVDLLEMESLALLDPDFPAAAILPGTVASRPFPFDWPSLRVAGQLGACAFVLRGQGLDAELAPAVAADVAAEACLLFYENSGQARRLLPEASRVGLAAAPCLERPGDAPFRLARREDGELEVLVRGELLDAPAGLRLWVHDARGGLLGQARCELAAASGEGYFASGLRLDRADAAWCALALVRAANPGLGADLCESVRALAPLWRYDQQTRQRINQETGRPMQGRQDFPPLHETDGVLALARLEDLARLEALLAEGRVAGHVLSRAAAARVADRLGLLQALALAEEPRT